MRTFRFILCAALMIGMFGLGRYSAHGAAAQIPMKLDQFLAAMGMVKVTMETVTKSQQRIRSIAQDQMAGKLTRSEAAKAFDQAFQSQQGQVAIALMPYINRNLAVTKDYVNGPNQLTDDMLHTVEYLQTKFPALFSRFMN